MPISLRDRAVRATKIDERLSVIDVRILDLADKDRMVAAVADFVQTALKICKRVDQDWDPSNARSSINIFEFVTGRSGKTLGKIRLRFVKDIDDKST